MINVEKQNLLHQEDAENVPYYLPGFEPENIKQYLKIFFADIDTIFPDKQIIQSKWNHERWDNAAKTLCKALGYKRGKTFLEAYGYTVFLDDIESTNQRDTPLNPSAEPVMDENDKKASNNSSFTNCGNGKNQKAGFNAKEKISETFRLNMPLQRLIAFVLICIIETVVVFVVGAWFGLYSTTISGIAGGLIVIVLCISFNRNLDTILDIVLKVVEFAIGFFLFGRIANAANYSNSVVLGILGILLPVWVLTFFFFIWGKDDG